MDKKKVILIGSIAGILLLLVLLLLLNGREHKDYNDYVDDTIHADFSNKVDYDLSWNKDVFDPTTVSHFDAVTYPDLLEEDISEILKTVPEWLGAKYAFYPEDYKFHLEAIAAFKTLGTYNVIENSSNNSYYSYTEANTVVMNIDGEDYVFILPYDKSNIYIYKLRDELK